MKKLIGILVILLLVVGGCGQVESEMSENDFDKITEDNKKYEKAIKKFAKGIVDIADEHDNHMDNEEYTDIDSSEFLKELENRLKNNREKFTKSTNELMADGSMLGDHLIKISRMYETSYNETSRLYKLNGDNKEYDAATSFAIYTFSTNFIMALYETDYAYNDIGKDERDMLLGTELSNELDETLVVTDGELETSYSEIGEIAQYDEKITIPESEYEKFYTDDASWKVFKLSGVHDDDKETTQTEYNETVEEFNMSVHPIMQTQTIDGPTSMTVSNHLITKWNSVVEFEDTEE